MGRREGQQLLAGPNGLFWFGSDQRSCILRKGSILAARESESDSTLFRGICLIRLPNLMLAAETRNCLGRPAKQLRDDKSKPENLVDQNVKCDLLPRHLRGKGGIVQLPVFSRNSQTIRYC